MPEPTAREALLSLAAELDRYGTNEDQVAVKTAWQAAAQLARSQAQAIAATSGEPETGHREGATAGEPTGHLSATERDAVLADLGRLLDALGLGDYARPESPHEVMLQCIAEVERLRDGDSAFLTAAARAERERIALLAEEKRAFYRGAREPCTCRPGCPHEVEPKFDFADLIREQS
jgi:hypothetical protein